MRSPNSRSFIRPFVRSFVPSSPSTFTSKFRFLYISNSCESQTLDSNCPWHTPSTHLDPVPLTYISRSIDFVNFYVEVTSKFAFLCIIDSREYETLHSNFP